MIVMLTAAIAVPGPKPDMSPIWNGPWISWTGGFFGAIFIAVGIFMVPRLGAATVLALIVVGQMLGAIAFDHFGILGVAQHAASPARLAGAALLILGVVLVRM